MQCASIRIITDDLNRLVSFYEQITGMPAERPAPPFAEFVMPSVTLAIGHSQTVGLFGAGSARAADNHSLIIEFRVDDVDAEYTRLKAFVRTDVACDLLALIGHLDGPAVIVGRSISGGAATIATAKQPELVRDRRDQPVHQG